MAKHNNPSRSTAKRSHRVRLHPELRCLRPAANLARTQHQIPPGVEATFRPFLFQTLVGLGTPSGQTLDRTFTRRNKTDGRFLHPRINANYGYVVGVDIGGTNLRVALADMKGSIRGKWSATTKGSASAEMVVAQISKGVDHLLRETATPRGSLRAIAAGAPGVTDRDAGIVFATSYLKGWKDVPLAQLLKSKLARSGRCGKRCEISGHRRKLGRSGARHPKFCVSRHRHRYRRRNLRERTIGPRSGLGRGRSWLHDRARYSGRCRLAKACPARWRA